MRAEGYYWIRYRPGCDLEIAEFLDDPVDAKFPGLWRFFGTDLERDSDLIEVLSDKLEPPAKTAPAVQSA